MENAVYIQSSSTPQIDATEEFRLLLSTGS